MSISQRALLAGPFVVSVLLVSLARPLTGLTTNRVISAIREASAKMNIGTSHIPPHVTPEYIADYIDYASDITGNISALVLAIVGLLLMLIGNPDYWPTIALATVGIPLVIILILRALVADPLTYNSRRRTRLQLSPSSALVILLNVAGVALAFTG